MPPSFPHLTDEYVPTNPNLWEKVLEVARGDMDELTIGGRTIHKPDGYVWPSPPASAWAVKQYKGFGGNWKKRSAAELAYQRETLRVLLAGGVVTTTTPEEHACLAYLEGRKMAKRIHATGRHQVWDAGKRVLTAGLADELTRRVEQTIAGPLAPEPYGELASWVDQHFRIDSAKTPRGQKAVKEEAQRFLHVLRALGQPGSILHPGAETMVQGAWDRLKPDLGALVQFFTAEGDAARGKQPALTELKLGQATYYNRSNLSRTSFERYAKGVDQVLASLKGWRRRALTGNLKVAFVGAKAMKTQGKYKQAEDTMLVRATPKVLKRATGYGTVNYIIVHELAHRYEKFHGTGGVDFDQPKWWTTRYSRTESMAGSESFAELFALGHFRLTGSWDPGILDRFEGVMSGGSKE